MALRRSSAVTVVAVLFTIAPATAHAAWRAESIPGTAGALSVRTLAVDRQGRALAVFEAFLQQRSTQRFTGLAVRANGTWSRAGDLAGIGWGSARVHLYARTRALLVTRRVTGFGAFNRARFELTWAPGRSDGTFSALRRIAASADVPASAANGAGDALVVFARQGGSTLRVSERRAGGAFGRPRIISPTGAVQPAVAVNDRGDRVVAWLRADRLEARIRRCGHSWGSVLTAGRIIRTSNEALHATIAPNGRVVLAWEAVAIREDRPVQLEAGVAVRALNAGWHSALLERSTLGAETFAADPAAIPLVGTRGRLWVASSGRWKDGTGVRLAHVSPTARVADTALLSAQDASATLDDAATGPQDRMAVTWAVHLDDGSVSTVAALRPGDTAFEPAETLTPDGEAGLVGSRVAFSPLTGEAVVIRPLVAAGTGALEAAASDPGSRLATRR